MVADGLIPGGKRTAWMKRLVGYSTNILKDKESSKKGAIYTNSITGNTLAMSKKDFSFKWK